ncbi:MAG TPA: tetratricopeptide repeat protein [Chitinophagaceae bacterium]|jgi:tetratricopeptide (TPR) repeat protein|nr:tetratricopeptide repeat protein [Chitinophagaceae bacterium]
MKLITGSFILFILLFGVTNCGNNNDSSPYEELLSRPPYANLTDSIHQNSSDPELYYRRGNLLFKNNNNPPALADFRKAWSLNKNEKYAVSISNVLLNDKPDSAISFLKEALKTLPESVALQINLVQAYANQQKINESLAVCNHILERHPEQVGVLLIKSDLLEQKNDVAGSIQTLEQAYHYAPFNEDICYNLAFKYAQNKNPNVLPLCDSLLRNDTAEKKAEPYHFKGVYYSNINNKAKALEYFNKAIQNDYTFLDAYMEKGKILFEQKKYNYAANVFQLALKVSTTFADAYYWLGKCQEAVGQKEEAKLNYQRAYGLDKTLTEAKEAADKLK